VRPTGATFGQATLGFVVVVTVAVTADVESNGLICGVLCALSRTTVGEAADASTPEAGEVRTAKAPGSGKLMQKPSATNQTNSEGRRYKNFNSHFADLQINQNAPVLGAFWF
jgi:hypothetical protein